MICTLVMFTLTALLVTSSTIPPIVIVPGMTGSRLQAKYVHREGVEWYCSKVTDDWFDLWINSWEMLPLVQNCWAEAIRLEWVDGKYQNAKGVLTRVVDFGNTTGIEFLDPRLRFKPSNYMHDLVDFLVGMGGERGISIRGAPYDWRYAPNSIVGQKYMQDLKRLIEHTYTINRDTQVSLLAHSMGCQYALWFLNSQEESWKDKYIAMFIPTAPSWGGAIGPVRLFASGMNKGAPVFGKTLVDLQRTWESNYGLLPTKHVFGNEAIIFLWSSSFTAKQFGQFFIDIDFYEGFEHYTRLAVLREPPIFPGVPTHMFYSTNISTPMMYSYLSENPSTDTLTSLFPTAGNFVSGDGTMSQRASEWVLDLWDKEEFGYTNYQCLEGRTGECGHTQILYSKRFLNDLIELLNPKL